MGDKTNIGVRQPDSLQFISSGYLSGFLYEAEKEKAKHAWQTAV